MAQARNTRRFKINPFELAIFSVVSLMFLNSLYKLFYDWEGFKVANMDAITAQEASRELASQGKSIGSIVLDCRDQIVEETRAARVRIKGELCSEVIGKTEDPIKKELIKTNVVNLSNQGEPPPQTFTFPEHGFFNTNFMDLGEGTHHFQLVYQYKGVPFLSQKVTVHKK